MAKRLAFDICPHEIDFIIGMIEAWCTLYSDVRPVFCVDSEQDAREMLTRFPHMAQHGDFVLRGMLEQEKFPEVRLMVTTSQYNPPVRSMYNYCCFHGQPSKGQTLARSIDANFDGFFLYGPLHRKCIEEYYTRHHGKIPQRPVLYDVGYSKSDPLLNGAWERTQVLTGLGLDPQRKTVLYAPAFNAGASLREFGPELIERLAGMDDCNVVIKLAVDNFAPAHDLRCNGGVDWFQTLARFEQSPNIRVYRELRVDPILAAADVLITDVSSVGFEFMVLGKPVVFIDTPKFYTDTLKILFPHEDTAAWVARTEINGGREFGLVAATLDDLVPQVRVALQQEQSDALAHAMREKLLYHAGNSTLHAVKLLHYLLQKHSKERAQEAPRQFARAHNRGQGFINAREVEYQAEQDGLSVNDYLETHEDTPKKIGRRNRIIAAMAERKLLQVAEATVLEIGTGTGRFTEKVLEFQPQRYEIYETAADWCEYLQRHYGGAHSPVQLQPADGVSLCYTATASCDLVHAHAVFVYLSFVNISEYLIEIARVCKSGGHVCIDLFYDTDWSLFMARCWAGSGLRFPTVLPRKLMEAQFAELGFTVVDEFTEIYGASFSRYVVLQKD